MHDGYIPSLDNITIPKDEYQTLLKTKETYKNLIDGINKLQHFKIDFNANFFTPGLVPVIHDVGYIRFKDLTDLLLTDEEIAKRNRISEIDEEINRLNAEREKLSNGK